MHRHTTQHYSLQLMDISYQYYNEITLFFNNYETDFQDGIIILYLPDDGKRFETVFAKVESQIEKIAETLEPRDKEITIKVSQAGSAKEIRLPREDQ